MIRFLQLLPALVLAAFGLLGPAARAQSSPFTSYAQFNDTLVARFNHGDFQGIELFGSPALRKLESAGSMSRFLANWQAKTGRVTSNGALGVRGQRHEFAWNGEKQNLRVTLLSPTPGVIDDYTISELVYVLHQASSSAKLRFALRLVSAPGATPSEASRYSHTRTLKFDNCYKLECLSNKYLIIKLFNPTRS